MKNKTTLGYTYIILSAIIYGCMPVMAKYIYNQGVNSLTLVLLRNVLALPILAVLLCFEKRSKQNIEKASKHSIFMSIIPSMFGCVITPILLFSSYNYLNSGTATVFHFIYPSLVLLIGIIFLKKKPKAITLLGVIVCLLGIIFFYDPSQTPNGYGALLAFSSGLTFAIYVTLLPRFQNKNFSGFTFGFFIALWSSIMMLAVCLISGQLMLPTSLLGWGLCILFSTTITVCAVTLFQQGTLIIGSVKASVLSAFEPITSVIVGVIIFQEPSKPTIIIGSALVIASGILIAIADLKLKSKK